MSRLTHQSRQSYDAQITAFALGLATTRQFSWSGGGDVRVKVGGVKGEHVGRQFEASHSRAGDLDLRFLKLFIGDLRSQSVKRLASEC